MQQLPQEIEKALALTGKKMDDIEIITLIGDGRAICDFSIEKFCFYLLSPEFIEKYCKRFNLIEEIVEDFGTAIHEYQKNNPKLLIDLLSKI